ncbi:hypothetical protein GNE10_00620 [Nostoc sp. 2RC]|nr:hypothetical protein [Nostoc sp. 2RC]
MTKVSNTIGLDPELQMPGFKFMPTNLVEIKQSLNSLNITVVSAKVAEAIHEFQSIKELTATGVFPFSL